MNCISTRGQAPVVSLKQAVLAGIAPDGGLYVPSTIERRPDAWWSALRGKSFQDVAIAMALEFAGDEFDHGTLAAIIRDALNFPVRMVELEKGLGVLELFHGPTFAFKDFGARTLARLMMEVRDGTDPLTILVATSGDTGSAVAHAFFGVPGTRVVVLYPAGQVSAIQEAQFTTLGGNVSAVAVQGTFDDCQRLAKDAFADRDLNARVRLTSANSISLGRLLPQMFYYAYAALQFELNTPLVVSVPSGNFGNLVAGLMAWKMGAPISQFSAPTTVNDTVPRYFASGRVEPRPSVQTLANAMDVGNPSNLERVQWLFGGELDAMRETVITRAHTDEEVRVAVQVLDKKYGYVADPHTAIGYLGLSDASDASGASGASGALGASSASGASGAVFLATAHPAKFRDVIEPIIGRPVVMPEALAETLLREKRVTRIAPRLAELSKLL